MGKIERLLGTGAPASNTRGTADDNVSQTTRGTRSYKDRLPNGNYLDNTAQSLCTCGC